MADEIIDFYKKAKEPEEPQKPIEEQKETPVPEIPKPDEPFDRFLLELAEKLQKEKVITEKQQETFVEQIKEPVSTDPNENDPFKKFIGSFANILKEDELVNREENIKEATISFINKLKEQPDEPFVIPDEPLVKTKKQKYLPSKIAKKIQRLPQSVKKEEPVVEEQADELVKQEEPNDENRYVKELKTADKTNKKLPEKVKSVSDIKSIVEKQVAEILSRYPNLGFTGGGGGTNAVQYALGGTMDGDLNVTGKYLSGGVDISTLFGSGGGAVSGIPDRLISGSQSLILNTDGSISFPDGFITAPDGQILNIQSETVSPSSFARISLSPYAFFAYDNEGNSISFDVVDNAIVLTSKNQYEWTFNQQGVLAGPNGYLTVNALSSLGRILSGGKDLLEIFALSGTGGGGGGTGRDDVNTVVVTNSANWNTAYNVATAYQSVSSSYATSSFVDGKFLPLSGGTITGNLSVLGDVTYIDTNVQLTSAMFIDTNSTETALRITQKGSGDVIRVEDSANPDSTPFIVKSDGLVGIGTDSPNSALTVSGNISASGSSSFTSLSVFGPSNKTILTTNLTEDGTVVIGATGPHAQTILFTPRSASIYSMGTNGTVGKIHSTGTTEGIGINNNLGINGYISIGTFSSTVRLYNEGANILAQRTGSPFSNFSPQTYRLYNSYTNASNYQRSTLTHANSSLVIGTQYTTTAGNSALSSQAMPIILAPGYNQSLSATAPIVLQQTWNNANNAFTLLSANVTDTASNASSNLLDLQVGGLSKFRITKTGVLQLSSNTSTVIDFTNSDNSNNFFRVNSAGGVTIGNNGGLSVGQSGITTTGGLNVSTTVAFNNNTLLQRDSVDHIIAQRNGLNPQTFRIYNTYTAGTPVSSEFGYTRWSGNTFQIGTSATGSGSNRGIEFQTAGSSRWSIDTNGKLFVVGEPGSGGWQLASGWMCWRQGSTNHWAVVDGNITARSTGYFQWSGNTDAGNFSGDTLRLSRSAGGTLLLTAGTSTEHRIQFGGSTAAFPALKNSLSGIQIRRADDSGFAPLTASNITATNYLSAGVNLLDIFSGGGGGVTHTYRFDYIPDTSYSGKATSGSLETDNVWTINRTIFTNTGTVSATGKATNVAWTDRLSAIYI